MADPTTVVRRAGGHASTSLGDEVVAMHVPDNTIFTMNETASVVWELAAEPTTIATVLDVLVDRYDVDRPTCEREVVGIVDYLVAEELLVIVA